MTLPGFVLKNIARNPRRTALTALSIAVSMALVTILQSFLAAMFAVAEMEPVHPRFVVRHRTSLAMSLPVYYRQELEAMEGVKVITLMNWFGGVYGDGAASTMFPRFAVDADKFFQVYPDLAPDSADELEKFKKERTSAMAGKSLMEQRKWKIGDKIAFTGDIYPVDLEVTLVGSFSSELEGQDAMLVFHEDYLKELIAPEPERIGLFMVMANTMDDVPRLIREIDAKYRNTPAETKSETEAAFALSFVQMLGDVRTVVQSITLVVIFTMLCVAASTMALAVRERAREVAVLKTLGFKRMQVLALIVAEGAGIGFVGGCLGVLGTYGVLPRPKFLMAFMLATIVFLIFAFVCVVLSSILPEAYSDDERPTAAQSLQRFLAANALRIPLIAFAVVAAAGSIMIPKSSWISMSGGMIPSLPVPLETVGLGLAIALGVGFASSIVPAYLTARATVLEGFRNIG